VLDVKRRGGHRRAAQGRRVHLAPDTQEAVAELTVRPTDAADTRLTSDRALDADVEDGELIAGRTRDPAVALTEVVTAFTGGAKLRGADAESVVKAVAS